MLSQKDLTEMIFIFKICYNGTLKYQDCQTLHDTCIAACGDMLPIFNCFNRFSCQIQSSHVLRYSNKNNRKHNFKSSRKTY